MDYAVLRKKLTSYKTPNGIFKNLSNELLMEVLRSWEHYTGPFDRYAHEIGVRKSQLGPLIHKARKIAKTSEYQNGGFKEIRVKSSDAKLLPMSGKIELVIDQSKVIRFEEVDLLIDFL